MEDPLKRKEALLQEELRHYSSKKRMLLEEKFPSDKNKTSIPYRSHKITLPDLGPIEFEQLDLPQLPSNVTLEKLLELANHTSCSYLDINQYLIYPSDEDSDDSIRSWTTDDTPHYRKQAGGAGASKSSEDSEFEELSCPSLVSDDDDDDDDDDVIGESHDQDGEATGNHMDTPTDKPPEGDVTNPPEASHDPETSHDADISDAVPSLSLDNKPQRPCDPLLESHDLNTESNGASYDQFPDEAIEKAVSLESPDLPPFDLDMPLGSPDLEPTPPGSPDDIEVTLTMPDPAEMLPVIPPPVSHDLVSTPPDPITISLGSHDTTEQSTSPDLLAALHDNVITPLESCDPVTTPLESHDTETTPSEPHDAVTTSSESHDVVTTPPESHSDVATPTDTPLDEAATPPSSPSSTAVNEVTDLDLD